MSRFLTSINFAAPTWDLFILLFFLVFALLYGLSLGRDRILVIIVAIYMALAVVNAAPFLRVVDGTVARLTVGPYVAVRVTAFLAVFLATFFLLSRSALMGVLGTDAHGPVTHVVLFSILHVGLLTSTTLSFLPPEVAGQFAPITRSIFLSEGGRFLWVVLPVIAIVFLRGSRMGRSASA